MAERLTKKISETIQDKYSLGSYLYYDFAKIDDTNKLLNKLGELEDILEKYDIESIEELDNKLKILQGVELLKEHDCDINTYVICEKDVIDKYVTKICKTEVNDDKE